MGINQEPSSFFQYDFKLPVISRGIRAREQTKHTLDRDNQAVRTDLQSEILRKPSRPQARNAHDLRLNTNLLILSSGQRVHVQIT